MNVRGVGVKHLSENRPQERWENIPAEERLQEEPPPRYTRPDGAGQRQCSGETDRNEIQTTTLRITGNARENRGHKAHGPSRINVGGEGGTDCRRIVLELRLRALNFHWR